MKPTREVTVREYMPGSYEVECDGRITKCPSRGELRLELKYHFDLVSDPEDEERIEELEEQLDKLSEVAETIRYDL